MPAAVVIRRGRGTGGEPGSLGSAEQTALGREVSHAGSTRSVPLDADVFLLAPEKLDRHFDCGGTHVEREQLGYLCTKLSGHGLDRGGL